MHALLALPLLGMLASARMQHVRRGSPTPADKHCRLAARLANGTNPDAKDNSTVAATWFQGWGENYTAADVPWDKYTHVTYSFAIPQPDGSLDLTESGGEEGLKTFVTAAHNTTTKALVSIGGWTGSTYFSSAVDSAENRTAFVKTVAKLVSDFQLDGIDFDWEYPVTGGQECNVYGTNDTANFLLFLQELRQTLPTTTLSAAAGVAPWKDASGEPSADVSAFAKLLDWVAIMNYDEYGQWSSSAGPNAALNDTCVSDPARAQGSAVSAVAAWTKAGIPTAQLVLGVASYGHAFNVSSAAAFGGAANATDGAGDDDDCAGTELALFPAFSPWALEAGEDAPTECGAPAAKDVQFTFAELVTAGFLDANGTATEDVDAAYDECAQAPFVFREETGTYVSYDDARSFKAKGEFVKAEGLRGFAMWEASGDHNDILLDSIRAAVDL